MHGLTRITIFQSTPPRGRRHSCISCCGYCCYFNPLRREGGDFIYRAMTIINKNFNPLRREGGDQFCTHPVKLVTISIHSAARAETVDAVTEEVPD